MAAETSAADRDLLRSRVYSAEDQWSAMLDRGGVVDFFGSTLVISPQRRFADIDSMQRYVDAVLDLDAVRSRCGSLRAVRVRARQGQQRAHYACPEPVIAIPTVQRWAGRESVLLHELTHHVRCCGMGDPAWASHGPGFVETLLWLVGVVMGPEQALVLRSSLHNAGVPTPSDSITPDFRRVDSRGD